ncbi:general transcription factor II-I repeat domain-containing protein 1 [Desmophyllum pertusum]|uniref:General transcription factor II-I repeat domain-containing protein 1 n=1 Tax=Desmophyllum pertusum TaxID=174260 RepID=A0A9W9YHD7_9CNID|nr:general transcription factor II-I repeat domain-containing protein 1 [Desmophyllum pertusum]
MLLEDLGCHSSMMLVDPCGELFNLGSAEGVNILITNHDVVAKFRQHFYVQCKRYTYRHVQSLFNKKYSEAIAKPGSRVPYLRGNFTVEGLPPGLVFKKPFCYGAQQCKAIMEAEDAISFVISNEVTTRNENDNPPESNTSYTITLSTIADDCTIASTLRKVASEANIEDVISKTGKQLEEDDIDVEDCSLTQDERLTLYTHCRDFLMKMPGLLFVIIQRTSATRQRTSSSPYTLRRQMRIFGCFIVLGKHFPVLIMPGLLLNWEDTG